MADMIIKPSSGNSLVFQDEGGDAALTVATNGTTTFAEAATLSGGVAGNTTFTNNVTAAELLTTTKVYSILSKNSAPYGDVTYDTQSGDTTNITKSGVNITLVKAGVYHLINCFTWSVADNVDRRYIFGYISSVSGTYGTTQIAMCGDSIEGGMSSSPDYGGGTCTTVREFAAGDVIKSNFYDVVGSGSIGYVVQLSIIRVFAL